MKNPSGGVREWLSLEFDEAQQLSDAGEVSRGYTVTSLHISVHAKAEFCKRTDWADLETRLLAFSELREVVVRVIPAEHTFDAPVADFLDAARAILDIIKKMDSLHRDGKLRVGFAPAAWMSNRADVVDVLTNLLRESSGGVLDEVCRRLDVHANWRRLIRSQHDIRATYGLQDSRSQ